MSKIVSEKQLIANRLNAKKGGVKTKEGKEISKMNALTFGIYSPVFLDEIEKKRYNLIVFDLEEEYKPSGISEENIIREIAMYEVKLHRLSLMEERYYSISHTDKMMYLAKTKEEELRSGLSFENVLEDNGIYSKDFLLSQIESTKILQMNDLVNIEKMQQYRNILENRKAKCLNELIKIKYFKKNLT